jgi:hypothetical protein
MEKNLEFTSEFANKEAPAGPKKRSLARQLIADPDAKPDAGLAGIPSGR